MNSLLPLTDHQQKPKSGGKPEQLVVLVHGYGADGADLIGLAEWFAPALPDAHFTAPNAPEVCARHAEGRQWFSLEDRTPEVMLAGVRRATAILNRYLDETLNRLGLENTQLALIGFSQGTMTSLHLAMRRSPAIAALVGFSGAMTGPETLQTEHCASPPVCLIHGQTDQIVPHESLQMAVDALTAVGVSAQAHSLPRLGHGIDQRGIRLASEFLQKQFLYQSPPSSPSQPSPGP